MNSKTTVESSEVFNKNLKEDSNDSNFQPIRQKLMENALTNNILEITPLVAIPYALPVYSITLTRGPKWLFTGGEDGLIRKFDFFGSVEGKSPLTVAQRHQLVDSISFGGLICSYWENEIPFYKENLLNKIANDQFEQSKSKNKNSNKKIDKSSITLFDPPLSPVYSMCVENNGNWLLSGLKNGGITLQSVRSNEGSVQWYFKNLDDYNNNPNNANNSNNSNNSNINSEKIHAHNDTISCLKLNSVQNQFLSGSWDRKIILWDLNTGEDVNLFNKSTGQISSIDYRPIIGESIDWDLNTDDDNDKQKETDKEKGVGSGSASGNVDNEDDDDDMGSLFGDDDDEESENKDFKKKDHLDRDNKNAEADDEDNDNVNDNVNNDVNGNEINTQKKEKTVVENRTARKDIEKLQRESIQTGKYEGFKTSDDIFLSSSINGNVNIWDSRLPVESNCVATIKVNEHSTPWCMSATWSSDGDSVFIGRRNAVVEEYDLRNIKTVKRTLRFPTVSGPISCVRRLPNKDYLLCGCQDNIRLYDLRLAETTAEKKKKGKIPFMIIPGHNGGILSDLYVDPTCRFMVSASGNRGWQGRAAEYVFIYEVLSTPATSAIRSPATSAT